MSDDYWKLVDEIKASIKNPTRRQTFEHELPNGMLVMVRYADSNSESCSVVFVPYSRPGESPYR